MSSQEGDRMEQEEEKAFQADPAYGVTFFLLVTHGSPGAQRGSETKWL